MGWEKFNQDFPYGAQTTIGYMNAQKLSKSPNIGVIAIPYNKPAVHMIIKEQYLVYGKDNELAITTNYDLEDSIDHVGTINPLNLYGTAMLHDFIELGG